MSVSTVHDGTSSLKNISNVAETSHQNQKKVLVLSTVTTVSEEKGGRTYSVLSSLTVSQQQTSLTAWPVKFAKHLWDIFN